MSKAFKVYPFAIAAGFGAQIFLAEGSYFRVKTASGEVGVSFDDNTNLGPINAGQGFKVPTGYKRLTLTDMSGAANTGTIIVAGDDFIDQQLSGVVQVIDGGKSRTLAGAAFSGQVGCPQGAAGTYPQAQLWNPVGSGKRVIVEQLLVTSSLGALTSSTVVTQTALTTLYANATNKNGGGSVSAAQLRYLASAAPDGGIGAPLVTLGNVQYGATPYKLAEPLVLHPGWGLNCGNTVNLSVTATFEFYEELDQ